MGEIVRHGAFDPTALNLPEPGELPALLAMWAQGRADYWTNGESWLVVERLPNGKGIGVPFARGELDQIKAILEQLIAHYAPEGYSECWVRGRPGWARALKDVANCELHSVCYRFTQRA